MSSLPSEQAAIVAVIDPDVTVASTVLSAYIPVKNFHSFMAVIMAGTLGTSATLDAKVRQATDASGTGVKDITGKEITQLTQAGTDSDKQAIINVLPEELDVDGGFDHICISLTVAVATSDVGAVLLGFNPRRAPASDNDVSTVDEIVS
jgi:hypothetical protein